MMWCCFHAGLSHLCVGGLSVNSCIPVTDTEGARGGGVSHILAEKGVLASLYSKNCIEMQYFHQEGGLGVRRVRPMLDPPLVFCDMLYVLLAVFYVMPGRRLLCINVIQM